MDSDLQCYCGKSFYQQNAFSNHQRHCESSRQRLSLALPKAQEIWARKRAAQRLRKAEEDSRDNTNSNMPLGPGILSTADEMPQTPSPSPEPAEFDKVCKLDISIS